MSQQKHPTLLVLCHERYRWPIYLRQLAGMRRYATTRSWRVIAESPDGGAVDVRRLMRMFRPVAVISMLHETVPNTAFGGVPVVYFDVPPSVVPDGGLLVCHDVEFTAHLAARELFAAHCAAFAFAAFCRPPYADIPAWCHEREACFADEVRRRGGRLAAAFHPVPGCDEKAREQAMRTWLVALPRPCGIFAANDEVAAAICRIARRAGLCLPDDVAVVGVDNLRKFCIRTRPTVTSVIPDWEGGGFAAAAAVGDIVDGGRVVSGRREFRPLGIMRRESTTRASARTDPRIEKAVALIRAKACSGLCAATVASTLGGSRRSADSMFRDATGASILEEIRRVRFETARILLSKSCDPLAEVAAKCGYESLPTFCREFKRLTGMTPGDFGRASRARPL